MSGEPCFIYRRLRSPRTTGMERSIESPPSLTVQPRQLTNASISTTCSDLVTADDGIRENVERGDYGITISPPSINGYLNWGKLVPRTNKESNADRSLGFPPSSPLVPNSYGGYPSACTTIAAPHPSHTSSSSTTSTTRARKSSWRHIRENDYRRTAMGG